MGSFRNDVDALFTQSSLRSHIHRVLPRLQLVRSMTPATTGLPRRLLYVANEDWAFLLNRLPMARAAREAGFEVHVATRVNKDAKAIEAEGFILHRVPFRRGGLSPFAALPTILALRRVEKKIKPQIVWATSLRQ